jgi:signal peptidase II
LLPKKIWFLVFGFIILIVIDQVTKYGAFNSGFGDFLNILRPILGKELFRNYDFAFSLKIPQVLMYLIYTGLLSWLIYFYWSSKDKNLWLQSAVVLIFAGAASNLMDRALYGYVRDFINIFWGNVFNIADIFIITGILMLLRKTH